MWLALLISPPVCLLMSTWVMVWVFLEISTLSFCMLIKKSEGAMKYFIVQSVSSALLLMASILVKDSALFFLYPMALVALMVKIASSPFAWWFVEVSSKISWKKAGVLMTWQKLAPTLLLLYQKSSMIFFFILLSSISGSLSQMNQSMIKKIMAFSSVFNISWMLLAVSVNMKTFLQFTVLYWTTVWVAIMLFKLHKMESTKDLQEKDKSWVTLMVMANMGGIPPMLGFLAKWIVMMEALIVSMVMVLTVVLMVSAINLFIYMRVISKIIVTEYKKGFLPLLNKKSFFCLMVVSITPLPVIMI